MPMVHDAHAGRLKQRQHSSPPARTAYISEAGHQSHSPSNFPLGFAIWDAWERCGSGNIRGHVANCAVEVIEVIDKAGRLTRAEERDVAQLSQRKTQQPREQAIQPLGRNVASSSKEGGAREPHDRTPARRRSTREWLCRPK